MTDPHSSPDQTSLSIDEQLEQIIAGTEEALKELREELAAHRQLQAQHEAVEHLPALLDISADKWKNVRLFIDELVHELRTNREEQEKNNDDEHP